MSQHSIDRFLEACGASGPLCLNIEYQGRQEPVQRVLQQPFALIGRDARSDLFLSHDQVSRCHAYLQLIGGRLFCVDLHSRTGTHWESGPKAYGWLKYQRAIRVGPYWIRLVSEGQDAGPPGQSSAEDFLAEHGLPEATLEIAGMSGDSWSWRMTPTVALVGRSDHCRVRLRERSVSQFHCSLVRTPLGVWAIDLLGRGGIEVNEVFVRCTRLDDGDGLRVGKFLIRLHYDTPPISRIRRNPLPQSHMPPAEAEVGSTASPTTSETSAVAWSGDDATTAAQADAVPTQAGPAADSTAPSLESPGSPGRDLVVVPAPPPLPSVVPAEALLAPLARQMALMQQQMIDQFQQGMLMMFQMFHTLRKDQFGMIREELDHLHQLTQEIQTLQVELAKRAQGAQRQPAANGDGHEDARPLSALDAAIPAAGPRPVEIPPGLSHEGIHAWLSERLMAIQQERQSRWQKIVQFLGGK